MSDTQPTLVAFPVMQVPSPVVLKGVFKGCKTVTRHSLSPPSSHKATRHTWFDCFPNCCFLFRFELVLMCLCVIICVSLLLPCHSYSPLHSRSASGTPGTHNPVHWLCATARHAVCLLFADWETPLGVYVFPPVLLPSLIFHEADLVIWLLYPFQWHECHCFFYLCLNFPPRVPVCWVIKVVFSSHSLIYLQSLH